MMADQDLDYRGLAQEQDRANLAYSLKTLEFDKIINLLEGQAMSRPGRALCRELVPSRDLTEVNWRLAETQDFIAYILEFSELSLSGVAEIKPLLSGLEREIVPSCQDLNRLARFLRVVAELVRKLPAPDGEDYAKQMERPVYRILASLAELPECRQEIERCVASDDDLYDDASVELKQIRRQLIRTQDEVKQVLESLIRKNADNLQDSLVTLRNGRYVLPVKAGHKAAIKGLVHDASGSGQTLFIEPMAVVELNNKIRELEFKEKQEVERILISLGQLVYAARQDLRLNIDLLADLDFAQAKARLALKQKAFCPQINDSGRVILKSARHPLIPEREVVPIDFELGDSFDTLLITGPNTGGKTVSLKTCGLLSLMAMAGLAIPADQDSQISVFDQVLADIGDEQSIEQSLSTFSSHLKNLIRMLELTTERSLVLCDELGSGTDPSEGAALAIALLDAFRQKGAMIVATTHYQELKGYALNTPGVSNACCEFDTESLRPTYRLLIGVPGVSNALAIALRLGLDSQVIDRARAMISDEGKRFEQLISAIEQSKQQAVQMEEEIRQLHSESKQLENLLLAKQEELRLKELDLLARAETKAYQLIEDARGEIADEIARKEMEFARFKAQASEQELAEQRLKEQELSSLKGLQSRLKSKAESRADKLGRHKLAKEVKTKLQAKDIVVGNYYRAPALNFIGQAMGPVDKKGQLQLAKGQIQITVPLAGLERAKPPRAEKAKTVQAFSQIKEQAQTNASSEVKLIGMRVEEALIELDRAIDLAVLTNLDSLRVVHGKGSGALRSAVRAKAASDPRVKDFREAGFGDGDSGVTYLNLRVR